MTARRTDLQEPKFCIECGRAYYRRHANGYLIKPRQWRIQTFCGRTCVVIDTARKKLSVPLGARLMAKVQVGAPDACWPWLGYVSEAGYGKWTSGVRGNSQIAHRAIYQLCYDRDLPPEIVVRHLCHNPICCNPGHLLEGSMADNRADMIRAGRGYWQKQQPQR